MPALDKANEIISLESLPIRKENDKVKTRSKWFRASGLLLLAAVANWVAFGLIGSSVDEQGALQEPFGLIPIGWLFLFASVLTALGHLVFDKASGSNLFSRQS